MKENRIYDLKRSIKTNKEGMKFLKSSLIGIPYSRLSLDVTIRKELEISFFHEITMKLLELGWNNYAELKKLMGLDINYMDNILLELGKNDYINHYGQQIILSEKGKRELRDLKSIKIESDLINNLYINLIDGSMILEPQDINFYKAPKLKVALNEKIEMNMNYLISVENIIRDLYAERQKRLNCYKRTYDLTLKDELYRIIDIEKNEIFYHEEEVDIYLTEEDRSFVYIFNTNDSKQGELYLNCLRGQLIENQKSLDYLFDTKYYYDNRLDTVTNDIPFEKLKPLYNKKGDLELAIGQYRGNLDTKNPIDELEKMIYSDRIMFYKEYRDFIFDLNDTRVEEIFIISNRFYDLTGDSNIISIIGSLLNKNRVYIGHLNYPNNHFINRIKEQFGTNKNLLLKRFTEINCTSIYAGRKYIIDIYYNPVKFDGNIILEEIPVITFNKEKINDRLEKIRFKFQ